MHVFSCLCICIRVAAAAEEVIYEVVAEPQEPQGQAPPQEVREELAQGPANPSVVQQTLGKPRCMSYYFKLLFTMLIFYLLLVQYVLGVDWNPSCMIPRFP